MTETEMRIAIAEFCGWSKFMMGTGVPPGHEKDWSDWVRPIPNYPHDLNAMHEAEKFLKLENGSIRTYLYELEKVCVVSGDDVRNRLQQLKYVSATASQRAEALLRTIGKLKDK